MISILPDVEPTLTFGGFESDILSKEQLNQNKFLKEQIKTIQKNIFKNKRNCVDNLFYGAQVILGYAPEPYRASLFSPYSPGDLRPYMALQNYIALYALWG